jgi:hypothetical protein
VIGPYFGDTCTNCIERHTHTLRRGEKEGRKIFKPFSKSISIFRSYLGVQKGRVEILKLSDGFGRLESKQTRVLLFLMILFTKTELGRERGASTRLEVLKGKRKIVVEVWHTKPAWRLSELSIVQWLEIRILKISTFERPNFSILGEKFRETRMSILGMVTSKKTDYDRLDSQLTSWTFRIEENVSFPNPEPRYLLVSPVLMDRNYSRAFFFFEDFPSLEIEILNFPRHPQDWTKIERLSETCRKKSSTN